MRDQTAAAPVRAAGKTEADVVWNVLRAAARTTERVASSNRPAAFALTADAGIEPVALDDPNALIAWHPGAGWTPLIPSTDPRHALLDLYLPICGGTATQPITIGHLGQSLDGFIATHSGESQWVTGRENILHLHRLRALCDAVVVGAGTIAADDPKLTTRLVPGASPLRVVLDPARRLGRHHRVFSDASAETLYLCASSLVQPEERRFGCATIVGIDGPPDRIDAASVMSILRERRCARIFVEGGGITVSMFLEANLLDRLHLAIAPLIIGDGRPAIRLPACAVLGECQRPRYRVFRMGGDILFDCELGIHGQSDRPTDTDPPIARVI